MFVSYPICPFWNSHVSWLKSPFILFLLVKPHESVWNPMTLHGSCSNHHFFTKPPTFDAWIHHVSDHFSWLLAGNGSEWGLLHFPTVSPPFFHHSSTIFPPFSHGENPPISTSAGISSSVAPGIRSSTLQRSPSTSRSSWNSSATSWGSEVPPINRWLIDG